MTEKQEVTPEFVQYIKERDAALESVKSAQDELRETQCRLYDALQLVETLQKSSKSDTKAKGGGGGGGAAAKKTPGKKSVSTGAAKHENGLSVKSGTSATSSGVSSARASQISYTRTDGGALHPPIPDVDPNADTKEYYWKIAEKYPQLPMFTVLDAESKFMKADADHSGTIDMEELDKVLSDTVGMFTQKQLTEIMVEIDLDHNNTVDFMEALTVINKLVSRRKTNLPQSVQQNYSKTCVLQ
ncbi:uncharacterized protein LOC127871759 [Dreissena polymorpha]|uniref:EF-hand domain-containing protein n=1 Tax=Dreissena polymorpha TaxID=45954 RepID=A0A9D4LK96_DREPO|nr:uncharacterized protein LOC127871759 [Dreissena polymorpha]XP_052270888.1 uncharacterized protein LOC127871759 [Dreissena polymorpha]KAH3858987.1 hypothetical protein DPMN_101633 [Dreissena polymorpha]